MKGRKRNGQFDRENTFASKKESPSSSSMERGGGIDLHVQKKQTKKQRKRKSNSTHPLEKSDYHQKIYLDIAKHFFSKAIGLIQDENRKNGVMNLKKLEIIPNNNSNGGGERSSVWNGKNDEEIKELLEGSSFLEDQEQVEFEKDDDVGLKTRYQKYLNGQKLSNGWLNYDFVFKHRCSHIFISQKDFLHGVGESFKDGNAGEGSVVEDNTDKEDGGFVMKVPIPGNIVCMKMKCKNMWNLYKKRECERRRRFRKKITKYLQDIIVKENVEKNFGQDEEQKTVAHTKIRNIVNDLKVENLLKNPKFVDKSINLLQYSEDFMKIVADRCENCNNLFLSMNLFWGKTLCDGCYFNPHVIIKTMIQIESELIMLKEKINHPDYVASCTKDPEHISISEEEIKKATEDFDSFLQTFMKQNGLLSSTVGTVVEENKEQEMLEKINSVVAATYEDQMIQNSQNTSVEDILCETPLPFDGINIGGGERVCCEDEQEEELTDDTADEIILGFPYTF